MKISFIVQDLCGQGAQASTAAMVRGFISKGYDVDVLISPVQQDRLREGCYSFPLPESVHVIQLPSRHARNNILFLRKYLKTTDANVVVSTSGPYHKCHAFAKIGIHRPILHVMMDHGNWYGKESRLWGWLVYTRFDRHLFVNDAARRVFLSRYPYYPEERTHVVYNPAVDELFWDKVSKEPTHSWLKEKKCFTFITAGAFYPYKHQMVLLQAMNEIKDRVDARLILFGRGPLESTYRDYIHNHGLERCVSIGGFTSNLPAEMRAADAYLMSSDTESFGIVIVEALASGLPVISTDALYGPREILADGKYGTIVPVGDYKAMAEEMVKLINGPRVEIPDVAWNRFTESAAVEYFEKGIQV